MERRKKIDIYTVSFVNECSVRLLNLRQEAQDVQISTAVMKTAGDIFRWWDRFNVKLISHFWYFIDRWYKSAVKYYDYYLGGNRWRMR